MPVSASIIIDYDAKSRFERFWIEDTSYGSLPFIMPDQTHDGVPILDEDGNSILDEGGNPLLIAANWLVMFGQEAPQIAPWGVQFQASFQLNVMP
jgi:hypothetical protein